MGAAGTGCAAGRGAARLARLLRLPETPEKDPLRLGRPIADHLAQPGRRYLVVLDDLWSEEPLALLPEVASPHALLVTTATAS